MKQLFRVLPPLAPDYGGACEIMYELGGLVLIHDATGCTVNYVHFDEPRYHTKPSNVFCSGLCEIDAVMGNDDVVINKAIKAAEELKPNFIAFVGSSVPMVVGTDFYGIAHDCEAQCGIPCFGIDANGIRNYIYGASVTGLQFVKRFCGEKTESRGVNLLGFIPMNYGDLRETEIIKGAFTDVRHAFSYNMSFDDLTDLQNAERNIVVSAAGLEIAEYMKKKYGMPYTVGVPYEHILEKIIDPSGLKGRVLVIGEGIDACSMAAAITGKYGLEADALDIFEKKSAAKYNLSSEEEIKAVAAEYDVVVADPCFTPLVGKSKIIKRPTVSVSGGVFNT